MLENRLIITLLADDHENHESNEKTKKPYELNWTLHVCSQFHCKRTIFSYFCDFVFVVVVVNGATGEFAHSAVCTPFRNYFVHANVETDWGGV